MMFLRNLIFYLGLIPVTILLTILGWVLFFMPFKVRYWVITRWSHFFIFWAKFTCGLKYQVEGLEHLPKEAAIVLSNHQSAWETIFFQVLLPPPNVDPQKRVTLHSGFWLGFKINRAHRYSKKRG